MAVIMPLLCFQRVWLVCNVAECLDCGLAVITSFEWFITCDFGYILFRVLLFCVSQIFEGVCAYSTGC